MGRVLVVLVVAMGLAGCASEPVPKPPLTQEGYKEFGLWFAGGSLCVQSGSISPDLVAYNNRYMRVRLSNYSYNEFELQAAISKFVDSGDKPDQATCNTLALRITEVKQQRDANLAQSQANAQEQQALMNQLDKATPKPVYCNQIGTQTMCTSY